MLFMYSLPDCKWCIVAKQLLKKYHIRVQIKEIDITNKDEFKKAMKFKTFPLIFYIKGNKKIRIGGYSEISTLVMINEKMRKNKIGLQSVILFNKLMKQIHEPDKLNVLYEFYDAMRITGLKESQLFKL